MHSGRLGSCGALHVEATADAAVAIEQAGEYLAADPVELNVIWSILQQRAESGEPGRYWLLEAGRRRRRHRHGVPAGLPRRRSRRCRGSTRLPWPRRSRARGIASQAWPARPVLLRLFAGSWTERVRTAAVPEDAQRLYLLGRLVSPEGVPGRLRRADPSERELIIDWWYRRSRSRPDCRPATLSPAVDSALATGRLFVWDDGEARCVARATSRSAASPGSAPCTRRPTSGAAAIAAACVGALSEWNRKEEGANSVLYAQLGNPSSNAIYRRLGYRGRLGDARLPLRRRWSRPMRPASSAGLDARSVLRAVRDGIRQSAPDRPRRHRPRRHALGRDGDRFIPARCRRSSILAAASIPVLAATGRRARERLARHGEKRHRPSRRPPRRRHRPRIRRHHGVPLSHGFSPEARRRGARGPRGSRRQRRASTWTIPAGTSFSGSGPRPIPTTFVSSRRRCARRIPGRPCGR